MTDPTKPGPDADRIAELERERREIERMIDASDVGHWKLARIDAELARLRNEQGDAGYVSYPDMDGLTTRDVTSPSPSPEPQDVRGALEHHPAYWTFDAKADTEHGIKAYYFAPTNRAKPPYREQRHVTAILDIASDGTLAGVELVMGELPPPPAFAALAQSDAQPVGWEYKSMDGWKKISLENYQILRGSSYELRPVFDTTPPRPDASGLIEAERERLAQMIEQYALEREPGTERVADRKERGRY